MNPQRPIYPQRVRNKKRWADLAHVAHFGNFAHFSGFTTQNSELRTQDSGLRTQNSEPRTEERKVFYAERFYVTCNVRDADQVGGAGCLV